MRYLRFKRWLTELHASAEGLDAVYFEEVRHHAGVDAAHLYGGFMAQLTAWCECHAISYQRVPVGAIKKHATGKGNVGKAAMRARGFAPADDNEADALALLDWALATQCGEKLCWTRETVAQRLEEATHTARQLPPVRVVGYYNLWPTIQRMAWESCAAEEKRFYFPPDPAAVGRMLETMRWVRWLPIPQRHLVWKRAERQAWGAICRRFQCDRITAWQRWQRALDLVVRQLNGNGNLREVAAPLSQDVGE